MNDEQIIEESPDGEGTATVTRQRGTRPFPYADLNEAIRVARATWDTGGPKSQLDRIAGPVGSKTINSGTFRNKIGAARIFGLTRTKGMDIMLTPLGEKAIDPAKQDRARVEAFLHVAVFKMVYERHRGGLLPGAEPLERELAEFGVAPNQAERARQVLQRSAEQAGFFHQGKNRLVEPPTTETPTGRTIQPQEEEETPSGGGGADAVSGKPALIEALFRMLPADGQTFPSDQREKWKQALAVNLDLAYPETVTTGVATEPQRRGEQSQNGAQGSESQP